jgi:hypothetical protein
MKSFFFGAVLLLAACSGQPAEAASAPTIDNTAAPVTPQTRATSAVDTRATMDALTAGLTPSFPTPGPTPSRDTDRAYSTQDRPDDDPDLYQVHFMYVIPTDGEDRFRDLNGEIERSAVAANAWLAGQTGEASLRYDMFEGALDITFLQLPYTADEVNYLGFNALLAQSGFREQNKAYVVFYDGLVELEPGQSLCGVAYGATGTIFLQAYAPEFGLITCPRPTRTDGYAGHLELTIIHEVFHLLGAVPRCALNDDGGAHVTDSSYDLMAAGFYGNVSPELTVLDRNNDDYYGHGRPSCTDVANSVFMQPTRVNAEVPPGWPAR